MDGKNSEFAIGTLGRKMYSDLDSSVRLVKGIEH